MDNLEDILSVVDGVMVARGDLGVEVSNEYVPLYQRKSFKQPMRWVSQSLLQLIC